MSFPGSCCAVADDTISTADSKAISESVNFFIRELALMFSLLQQALHTLGGRHVFSLLFGCFYLSPILLDINNCTGVHCFVNRKCCHGRRETIDETGDRLRVMEHAVDD